MTKKLLLAIALTLSLTSSCAAHFLDNAYWNELGKDSYIASGGIEYSAGKPIVARTYFARHYPVPSTVNGLENVAYLVQEIQCAENEPQKIKFTNIVFYDEHGDVLFAGNDTPYLEDTNNLYPMFFPKQSIKHLGNVGKGTEQFYLPPQHWQCGAASSKYVIFYNRTSLKFYDDAGHKKVEAWLCLANLHAKTYMRNLVVFDKEARSITFKENHLNAYGDHRPLFCKPIVKTARKIRANSMLEKVFERIFTIE